jgi:hypothetical protein
MGLTLNLTILSALTLTLILTLTLKDEQENNPKELQYLDFENTLLDFTSVLVQASILHLRLELGLGLGSGLVYSVGSSIS